ncbi:hypothetical protein [Acinetobacter bereziniae]|nr:hypothetical protein [Acinetobacter bereziniae]
MWLHQTHVNLLFLLKKQNPNFNWGFILKPKYQCTIEILSKKNLVLS